MAESLASLWTRGVPVDWAAYENVQGRRARVALPTYPFDRQRYWIEQAADGPSLSADAFWAGIEEAGGRQAGQARLDLDVASYPRRWECLDRLTHAFITRTLVDRGVFVREGERHSLDSFMSVAGIASGYRKLMERWLVLLSARGVLSMRAGAYECVRPLEDPDVTGLTAEADVIFGGDRIFLDFVLRCGRQLPAILTGQVSSLETLFPNGNFALAEALYEHAPVSHTSPGSRAPCSKPSCADAARGRFGCWKSAPAPARRRRRCCRCSRQDRPICSPTCRTFSCITAARSSRRGPPRSLPGWTSRPARAIARSATAASTSSSPPTPFTPCATWMWRFSTCAV